MGLFSRWFGSKKQPAYAFAPYITRERSDEIIAAMMRSHKSGGDMDAPLYHKYGILYIKPQLDPSPEPVIDELTRKMTASFRQQVHSGIAYMGVHFCKCGAASSPIEHIIPQGLFTNSLCIHYLAFHRSEVPADQCEQVARFTTGEAEPSIEELHPPRSIEKK